MSDGEAAVRALVDWSLATQPVADVPIYKGMARCPYCCLEVDQAMIERVARELLEQIPEVGERGLAVARAVLREALHERYRS